MFDMLVWAVAVFFAFAMLPAVLFTLVFTILFYTLRIKHSTAISLLSVSALAVILFMEKSILNRFWTDYSTITMALIPLFAEKEYLSLIEKPFTYSLGSWILLILLSLSASGYFVYRLRCRKKLEQSGIIPMDEQIAGIHANSKQIRNRPVSARKAYPDNETIIGTDISGNMITCRDDAKHIFVGGTTGSGYGKSIIM